MHLVEISIFSLNNVTALSDLTNYEQSRQKLGTFLENKVFKKSKFSKTFFIKSWSSSPIFFKEILFGKIRLIFNTENQNFEMFEEVVHNFGKSDGDII